jgi:hypothetical protein
MEARKLPQPRSRPFQLSLRVRHPSLDPRELSREFGIEPVHCFRAGDPRPSRSSLAPGSVYAESYWLGALNPANPSAEGFLAAEPLLEMTTAHVWATAASTLGWALSLIARQLFTAHAEALRRIRHEGGQITLLVSLAPGEVSGFSLSPEVARVLSELGITVEFEFAND